MPDPSHDTDGGRRQQPGGQMTWLQKETIVYTAHFLRNWFCRLTGFMVGQQSDFLASWQTGLLANWLSG